MLEMIGKWKDLSLYIEDKIVTSEKNTMMKTKNNITARNQNILSPCSVTVLMLSFEHVDVYR